MDLLKVFIILTIGLTAICCKSQTSKGTENGNGGNLISEKGVLDLSIGNSMPEKLGNYTLIKSTKIVEEGNIEPVIILTENSVELIQISFEYDQEKGLFTNKIGEIIIKDKRFKTERKIGVESTIDDFISSYSNYYIWYTYISGIYVIESKDMKVQFILDENGYIGKEDLIKSDMVVLKKEDFSSKTKIVEIRIY